MASPSLDLENKIANAINAMLAAVMPPQNEKSEIRFDSQRRQQTSWGIPKATAFGKARIHNSKISTALNFCLEDSPKHMMHNSGMLRAAAKIQIGCDDRPRSIDKASIYERFLSNQFRALATTA